MKRVFRPLIAALAMILPFTSFCQLSRLSLDQKIAETEWIAEGKVVTQRSFWNPGHTMIYTSNTLEVSKVLKGRLQSQRIQVITQGGTVDNFMITTDHLLQLNTGDQGLFFLNSWNFPLDLPQAIPAFDVYGSQQGFYQYHGASASDAFDETLISNLHSLIISKTKQSFTYPGTARTSLPNLVRLLGTGTISSFSPLSVTAGTLHDPANNTLTISGSGFGAVPASDAAVLFKHADNATVTPSFAVSATSPYIISWNDQQIQLRVPDRAATGKIAVVKTAGDTAFSASNLDVFYSVQNATFNINGTVVVKEPRLMASNGSGGYSILYSTNTAGGGRDISSAPEKGTFQRALSTWKEVVGFNVTESGTTASQAVNVGAADKENIIMFDNTNTGVAPLASGVLAVTYNGFSMCSNTAFEAQKVGFDIVIRNAGVSVGNTTFTTGPCFPSTTVSEIDLETVLLHELGHAVNLGHVNDNYEITGNTVATVNPAKLMHFSVLNNVSRRSLDQSAFQGGLYCVTPQGYQYGNCSLPDIEMTPLPRINIANDECPLVFPGTPTLQGITKAEDLVHATSNKNRDPQFTAINCSNTGAAVTNNAYEVIRTASAGSLDLTVLDYITSPAEQAGCSEEGFRLAIYQVNSCPSGQNFPLPVACRTFSANGAIASITGLAANSTYLLFIEAIRSTKATFSLILNGSALAPNNTRPAVVISTSVPNPTNAPVITIKIDFSENVTGFDISRINVTGGTKTNFTGSGRSYTVDIIPTADGTITVNVPANVAVNTVNNGNTPSNTLTFVSDRTPPSIPLITSITTDTGISATDGITNDQTLFISGKAEPASVVSLFRQGIAGAIGTVTTNASGNWTFDYTSTQLGEGNYVFTASATDAAGNNSAISQPFTVVVDLTPPSVTISSPVSNPATTSPVPIKIDFTENVYGFDISRVNVIGGTKTNFAGAGKSYSLDIIPSSDNVQIVVQVAGNIVSDVAGNSNNAAADFVINYNAHITASGIFPNPAIQEVNVYLKGLANGACTIELFDDKGAKVYSGLFSVNSASTVAKVKIANLVNGLYHLQVVDSAGALVLKGSVIKIDK